MSNSESTVEVVVAGNVVKRHKGNDIIVDDNSNLKILLGSSIVCIYAQGHWFRAYISGNQLA